VIRATAGASGRAANAAFFGAATAGKDAVDLVDELCTVTPAGAAMAERGGISMAFDTAHPCAPAARFMPTGISVSRQ
jgi:hypothetical protein